MKIYFPRLSNDATTLTSFYNGHRSSVQRSSGETTILIQYNNFVCSVGQSCYSTITVGPAIIIIYLFCIAPYPYVVQSASQLFKSDGIESLK